MKNYKINKKKNYYISKFRKKNFYKNGGNLESIKYLSKDDYLVRNYILKTLGLDYENYLLSSKWIGIRSKVIKSNKKCNICFSNEDLQVHHLVYTQSNLMGYNTDWLVVLCKECHDCCHEIEKATGISILFSTTIYALMVSKNNRPIWLTNTIKMSQKDKYKKYGVFGMQSMGYL